MEKFQFPCGTNETFIQVIVNIKELSSRIVSKYQVYLGFQQTTYPVGSQADIRSSPAIVWQQKQEKTFLLLNKLRLCLHSCIPKQSSVEDIILKTKTTIKSQSTESS